MPGFTRSRRWQPAYDAFKRETWDRRSLASLERIVKESMSDCRICGKLELIRVIKAKPSVRGVHIMAVGREEIVSRIVTEAGLLPHTFVAPSSLPKPQTQTRKPA